MPNKMVSLEIHHADALVMYEFLSREVDDAESSDLDCCITHEGEFGVLSSLLCLLEKKLDEPFAENYQQMVAEAQKDCVTRYGSSESISVTNEIQTLEIDDTANRGIFSGLKELTLVPHFHLAVRDVVIITLLISHAMFQTA